MGELLRSAYTAEQIEQLGYDVRRSEAYVAHEVEVLLRSSPHEHRLDAIAKQVVWEVRSTLGTLYSAPPEAVLGITTEEDVRAKLATLVEGDGTPREISSEVSALAYGPHVMWALSRCPECGIGAQRLEGLTNVPPPSPPTPEHVHWRCMNRHVYEVPIRAE